MKTELIIASLAGVVTSGGARGAVALVKKLRIYPRSERQNPKALKIVPLFGKPFDTILPGIAYWVRLAEFMNNNPADKRDNFFMAMLKPLAVEKGNPIFVDARRRTILEHATKVGEEMARTMLVDGRQRLTEAAAFTDTGWNWVVIIDYDEKIDTCSQLDKRLHQVYGAICMAPVKKSRPGLQYFQAFKDKDGNPFDGGKAYHLRVSANAPVSAFWSLTLYDTETCSMIQTPSNDSTRSSDDKLKTNADGSVDLYFGTKAPAGGKSNWIQTVPGKGFYPFFRCYHPAAPLFEATWRLPDIELTT